MPSNMGSNLNVIVEALFLIPSQSHLSPSNLWQWKEANGKLEKQIKIYVFNVKFYPVNLLLYFFNIIQEKDGKTTKQNYH